MVDKLNGVAHTTDVKTHVGVSYAGGGGGA